MSNIPPAAPAQAPAYKPHPILSEFSFPPIEGQDFEALKADIQKVGQLEPIVIYEDAILDGCNRDRVCFDLGIDPVYRHFAGSHEDARALVISANLHRRHLTTEQRREMIAKLLEASPDKSDREIAKLVKRDHKTVAAVRKQAEDVGRIPHVDKRTDSKGRKQPAKKKRFGSVLPDGLPKPKAARQKAREEGRLVLASDGYIYTGATDEQAKEAEDQRSLVYGLERAVAHIASIDMTPAEFLKYAQHHQPNQIETAEDLARLERGTEWLTELVAIGRKRLRGAGTSTAETTAQSSAQAIADQQVDNVLKHADFGGAEPTDPAVDDPRQLDLIALITPQVEAKVEPTAQGPTDTGGGSDPGELPGFPKRAQSVPAEAAQ